MAPVDKINLSYFSVYISSVDKFLIEIDEVYESEMPFSSPNELLIELFIKDRKLDTNDYNMI